MPKLARKPSAQSSTRKALLEQRARQMRIAPTLSERILWQALRGRQLGVAFRRQVCIGSYIVDFSAPSARLIVEVDGQWHASRARADARRERWLRARGYRILRLDSKLVANNPNEALALILQRLSAEPAP